MCLCVYVGVSLAVGVDECVHAGQRFSFPLTKMLSVHVCLCAAANSQSDSLLKLTMK